jgi:hypothetical protein
MGIILAMRLAPGDVILHNGIAEYSHPRACVTAELCNIHTALQAGKRGVLLEGEEEWKAGF